MENKSVILFNSFESDKLSTEEKIVLNSLFQSVNIIISFDELSSRVLIPEADIATILIKLKSLGIISFIGEKICINLERFKLV